MTTNEYVPAAAKVATVFFAPFVSLAENETDARGVPASAQVYFKAASPPSPAPSAASVTGVPVTGDAEAEAGEATVGGDEAAMRSLLAGEFLRDVLKGA